MPSVLPVIESRRNPRFQQWLRMASQPQREDCPWVPVEGWKQVEELAGKVGIAVLLYCGRARHEKGLLCRVSIDSLLYVARQLSGRATMTLHREFVCARTVILLIAFLRAIARRRSL